MSALAFARHQPPMENFAAVLIPVDVASRYSVIDFMTSMQLNYLPNRTSLFPVYQGMGLGSAQRQTFDFTSTRLNALV